MRTNSKIRSTTRIAPGLATVAALLAISAACASFGSDDDAATASGTSPGPDPGTSSECRIGTGETLEYTVWDEGQTNGNSEQPAAAVVLTESYDLPATHGSLANADFFAGGTSVPFWGQPHQGLTQYEDGSLGVIVQPELSDDSAALAVVSPGGQIIGQYDASTATAAPQLYSGTPGQTPSGYHRVEADGVQIPAAAAGDEVNQNFVLAAMPDASNDGTVWALLRGSDALYRGTIYAGDPDAEHELGESFDTSSCS